MLQTIESDLILDKEEIFPASKQDTGMKSSQITEIMSSVSSGVIRQEKEGQSEAPTKYIPKPSTILTSTQLTSSSYDLILDTASKLKSNETEFADVYQPISLHPVPETQDFWTHEKEDDLKPMESHEIQTMSILTPQEFSEMSLLHTLERESHLDETQLHKLPHSVTFNPSMATTSTFSVQLEKEDIMRPHELERAEVIKLTSPSFVTERIVGILCEKESDLTAMKPESSQSETQLTPSSVVDVLFGHFTR